MPAVRTKNVVQDSQNGSVTLTSRSGLLSSKLVEFKYKDLSESQISSTITELKETESPVRQQVDHSVLYSNSIYFPTGKDRMMYLLQNGKKVTPHQWAVYDFIMKIPCGKVTTYKDICTALGEGSPRSVGSALRNNPFAPYVPCHRVVASDMYVGGFYGEWGTEQTPGSKCSRKVEMLMQEGLVFTSDGYVKAGQKMDWMKS